MKKGSQNNRRKSLLFQIPLRVVSAVVVCVFIMCAVLAVRQSAATKQSVEEKIDYLAENNAYTVTTYLNAMQTMSSSLANEVSRIDVLDDQKKDTLLRASLKKLSEDDRIFSAYVAFEPNAMFAKTPNGLSYYEYKDGSSKKMDVNNDYSDYEKADYYATTKQTKKAHITEPYSYKLSNGETVWLITISNPILNASGKFLGVANTDIKTSTLNQLTYNVGKFQTAHSYILTGNSICVNDTADKTKTGKKYTDSVADSQVYRVTKLLQISGLENSWTSTFSVYRSEALQEVLVTTLLVALLGAAGTAIVAVFIVRLLRKSLSPIRDVVTLTQDMGRGKLDTAIRVTTQDELGELASVTQRTAAGLRKYIQEISEVLGKISEGDLCASVKLEYLGDFAPIKKALQEILDALNGRFSEISVSADEVAGGSGQVASGAQALAQGATEQASTLEELSATITDISSHVKANAANAANANQNMERVREELERSNASMQEMVAAMERIHTSSQQISSIIKTIDSIAFQTNILALNAAVEAARAGEAGKGFAVVADEVRNLAGKSAQAAKNTTELIQSTIQQIGDGSKIAEQTAQALAAVDESVQEVSGGVRQISTASQQQAAEIEQVTTGVEQVSAVVQTNSATAEESSAASEELSGQAQMLKSIVSKFHLREQTAEAQPSQMPQAAAPQVDFNQPDRTDKY
ncbi:MULTISPECIES: methyl-accepting chemotaxis protein [Caproicibacterium]|uniref:Methyl-accepting chemotaxis protein n=1 Tax=Caproicibacterium argilliputei TaxID=3030016 RepID=A0AA97D6S5_9FIRM|nr:methyl-accepting chemotaxis protein [Caproicibacterium argilliputei]WOC31625.1 methyl-accepting chemotaxis protein [Caproicibacterium argilliputei]